MRLTVDIDEKELAQVQRATGVRKKSPAIKKAVEGFLYAVERRRFLKRVCEGKTDYSLTNDELEESGVILCREDREGDLELLDRRGFGEELPALQIPKMQRERIRLIGVDAPRNGAFAGLLYELRGRTASQKQNEDGNE